MTHRRARMQADMEAANEQGDNELLMKRHMFHQMKLEQVMRALENDQAGSLLSVLVRLTSCMHARCIHINAGIR